MTPKLSVVIIAKNEADRIGLCIQSVLDVSDDIVVVDNGSVDDTVRIAKELGANVFQSQWFGYGPTKNFGHSKAKNDWILSLDCDEVLELKLREEIASISFQNGTIYQIDRLNSYEGKIISHSGWSPDWVERIYNRNEAQWNENLVHERLQFSAQIIKSRLKHKLLHNSYRSIEDHREKIEKYAKLRAQSWVAKKKHPGIIKRLIGPFLKAFTTYIVKLGFLDGKEGLTIAKMNAYLVRRQLYHFDQLNNYKP